MVPQMRGGGDRSPDGPVMPARDGVGSGKGPLTTYRRAYRVVVALTPSRRDPDLAVQRRIFAALGAAAAERDLVLATYDDATPEGATLRRRFGGTGFRAILVGKDGDEKSSGRPLDADALLPPSTPCRCVARSCVGRRESEHQAA